MHLILSLAFLEFSHASECTELLSSRFLGYGNRVRLSWSDENTSNQLSGGLKYERLAINGDIK